MARREQVFHQFLRPLKGIGLPVNYNVPDLPSYESEIAFDRSKSKFLFSIEQNEGQEDFKWVTISRSRTAVKTSVDYTIDDDDYIIIADATNTAITINLPLTADCKENEYHIKRINSGLNTVSIKAQTNETIDGENEFLITTQYATINLISDGTSWYII